MVTVNRRFKMRNGCIKGWIHFDKYIVRKRSIEYFNEKFN